MNNDQQTVAWMVVLLILLTCWGTYKKYLSAMLFQPPSTPPKSFWTTGPGSVMGTVINDVANVGTFGLANLHNPTSGVGSAGTADVQTGATLPSSVPAGVVLT